MHPTLSEGVIGVYTLQTLPSIITSLISEPLVIIDQNGQTKPYLSSGWQINNNATIYTFKLKSGLAWSDGTRVISKDIKFNLPDVEVSYPNDDTIEFKLADSFSPFPTFLTTPILKGESLIGVGKFKVGRVSTSRGVVTKIMLESRDASLPNITIRFYPDEKTALTAFGIGEIDSLVGQTSTANILKEPGIASKTIPALNKLALVFYNTKDPILSDKNLRRALSFASPKIEGETTAQTSLPSSSWAFNGDVKNYLGDLVTAKTYLDKANLGDNPITLTTTPSMANVGEAIVGSWKKLGIPAVLRIESGIPQNFQALLITEIIPLDPDQYFLWHSTQTKTNISQYSSPRIDKDLEDGRKTADLEKRKVSYADFQRILLDDAPATFLYFPKTNIVYRQKVARNLDQILKLQFPTLGN